MKMLLITNELSEKSGWGRYSLDLARQFQLLGYQPIIICKKVNPAYSGFEQIALLPDPLNYKKCYLFFWFYVIRLFKYRRKLSNSSIVHCMVETYSPISTFLSIIARSYLFITVHGSFGIKTSGNSVYKLIQLFCYRHSKKIICVSHYTENRLLAVFPQIKGKIIVIPNGVGFENFSGNNLRQLKDLNNPILIGVGAIKKRKGFHVVLKSLPSILKKFPNVKYYIVGRKEDDGYARYLYDLIEELSLRKYVTFFYDISDEELQKIYHKSSVFVLTPISDKYNFEGFGLVYLEANASGLPVIGSYDNGGEEAIIIGKTGFLAKPNDPENTAQLVIDLLSDRERYVTMARKAIDWAKTHSWQLIAARYIQIYKKTNDN